MKYTVELNDWEALALRSMMKSEFTKETEFIAKNAAATKHFPELQSFTDMAEKERVLYNKVYCALRKPQESTQRAKEELREMFLTDLELSQEEINVMTPGEAFEAILNYEGYVHCAGEIKRFVQGIYGIDLDSLGV